MNVPQNQASTKKVAFFNNPANRAVIYQALLMVGLGYFFYTIISNTLANMEARGIKSGFDFLWGTAGFDILMSLIPYEPTDTYGRTFIVGMLNTVLVSSIGIVLSTVVGFVMGVAYFSHNWLIRKIATVYVETFRNIPLLLQVFFWYFAVLSALPSARQSLSLGEAIFLNVRGLYLPDAVGEPGSGVVYAAIAVAIAAIALLRRWAKRRQALTGKQFPLLYATLGLLLGLPLIAFLLMGMPFHWDYPALKGFNFQGGITIIPELMALALALTIYAGAFIAEAVRAGVQSVPHGQTEAARSLGMKEKQIMNLIVVPQAMRVITPVLNSEYQSLVKNSTLSTAIGYPDLFTVFVGTTLNQTGQAIEIVFMTMAVYFVFNMLISVAMNLFNKRVALVTK
ncbi:MAG: amino acid ABC transporter permease [Gammaproteobacteria bacterium]|jgi:general L-amino acid transport system permease protein|nr:amino acid ABC transporter permease [Gammaproteobacteria bacterium]MBT4608022.1 amino acid ABC transporter permease [Thiotrichales bacterium]MBT3471940.1 amino acid ABC transporter permease [Gammaproteobacteria bacterium]MBT3966387.1 amino acid ABC transporter permease [Gammaproteobacteria bacterium]MBT4080397.1 amino acid ABC transporter permease [Gammaproteobacteria bacterium]